jgi:hypothetical protein
MIDIATARKRVEDFLGIGNPEREKRRKHELVIAREQEYEFGWLFVYATKKFVETGDIKHTLVGGSPLIVDRNDGQIYATGTARMTEHYIDEYRRGIRHPVKTHHA